tara:strand:+ start:270 stop:539 length:270 start_codon:yes stop_codon:yes gene_type:complete
MKNKNLIYLALGLGALYFFTKKKDTETTETTTTSDLGNGSNDKKDDVADVVDTGVVDATGGGSNTGNVVVNKMQTGSSASLPSGVFTTV